MSVTYHLCSNIEITSSAVGLGFGFGVGVETGGGVVVVFGASGTANEKDGGVLTAVLSVDDGSALVKDPKLDDPNPDVAAAADPNPWETGGILAASPVVAKDPNPDDFASAPKLVVEPNKGLSCFELSNVAGGLEKSEPLSLLSPPNENPATGLSLVVDGTTCGDGGFSSGASGSLATWGAVVSGAASGSSSSTFSTE